MEMSGASYLIRRHASVLALLTASLAVSEQAKAACDQPSGVSNTTVNCSGTTTNTSPNGMNGYGTETDVGNTINVLSGATVTGTNKGLTFSTGAVNNSGTIFGGAFGIEASTTATVNNAGAISGRIAGINANITATVNNTGSITGTGAAGDGILANDVSVINASTGTIAGGLRGIRASSLATVNNAGKIGRASCRV